MTYLERHNGPYFALFDCRLHLMRMRDVTFINLDGADGTSLVHCSSAGLLVRTHPVVNVSDRSRCVPRLGIKSFVILMERVHRCLAIGVAI